MSDARQQAECIAGEAAARGPYLHEGLVSALAAAIEETWAEGALRGHALRDEAAIEKNRRLAKATEARREALSALGVEVDQP